MSTDASPVTESNYYFPQSTARRKRRKVVVDSDEDEPTASVDGSAASASGSASKLMDSNNNDNATKQCAMPMKPTGGAFGIFRDEKWSEIVQELKAQKEGCTNRRGPVLAGAQKVASQRYSDLSEAEKLPYFQNWRKAMQAYEVAMAKWMEENPEQIVPQNEVEDFGTSNKAEVASRQIKKNKRRCQRNAVHSQTTDGQIVAVSDAPSDATGEFVLASKPRRQLYPDLEFVEDEVPPGSEMEKWLKSHPLYDKIHRRGYPLPIGDFEILQLRAFTPKRYGGEWEDRSDE